MILLRFVSLFFFLGTTVFSFGQSAFPTGATWHYHYNSAYQFLNEARSGYDLLQVNGSQEIEGVNCQVVTRSRVYWSVSTLGGPSEWSGPNTILLSDQFVYSSGDTTFYFANNQFYILYIMDAENGASWDSFAINGDEVNANATTYEYTTRVTDSGLTSFNGTMRRYVDLEGDAGECGWGDIGRVIEGVGLLSPQFQSYFFPDYTWMLGCFGLSHTETFGFNCFESEEDVLYAQSDYCASSPVGLFENEMTKLSLAPNPSTDWVQLVANVSAEAIRWVDCYGRVAQEDVLETATARLDISGLSTGIYAIQVLVEGRWQASSSRFVKR